MDDVLAQLHVRMYLFSCNCFPSDVIIAASQICCFVLTMVHWSLACFSVDVSVDWCSQRFGVAQVFIDVFGSVFVLGMFRT